MGMTISQKIIAKHAKRKHVAPGEIVEVELDRIVGNDATSPIAIKQLEKLELLDKVKYPEKIMFALSHYSPAKDISTAEHISCTKNFARRYQNIKLFKEGEGIEHVILPEEGLVHPGMLIIGADSHTCTLGALGAFATGVGSTDLAAAMITGKTWMKVPNTIKVVYKGERQRYVTGKDIILNVIQQLGVDGALYHAIEHSGDGLNSIFMDERFTMSNMAIEAGAKTGIFAFDHITELYLKEKTNQKLTPEFSDEDASYLNVFEVDISKIEPQVSKPDLPSNSVAVSELEGMEVDQVYIGSCTNGRLSDLILAASIFKKKKVHPNIRAIVVPGSKKVYEYALKKGLIDIFVQAGCIVGPPSCGACFGGSLGILGPGERCLSTTNRNFTGRMGHHSSEIYLSNPLVAAATAVNGRITHPHEILGVIR
ncbi:MAG TPA: 3-isopropylmalate dehydratase large subunit [Bacillales bacterium]|nr:3-isopropylmalate dehydratase large subunit [Bacillales bacterium]